MPPAAAAPFPPRWANAVLAPRHHLPALIAALAVAHLLSARASEPFFNNDEIRHTMTGVFVLDALADLPASAADPKGYAVAYYLKHPAVSVLTWPPFFYLLEGAAMLAFGPTFLVGRLCVAGFAAMAVAYSYRFARLRLPHAPALLAAALTGFAPLVFLFSQRVMLEVPAMALALAAVVHFEKYLADRRGRDAVFACLLAACAVLTRYDGVFLLPYFLIRLVATRQFAALLNRPVILGVLLAFALVGPYFLLAFREYGGGLGAAAGTPTGPRAVGFLTVERLLYYPHAARLVLGWPCALVAGVALLFAAVRRWDGLGPSLGLLAAVYLTFTPIAELEPRHSIYWTPAWAVLVARLVMAVHRSRLSAGPGGLRATPLPAGERSVAQQPGEGSSLEKPNPSPGNCVADLSPAGRGGKTGHSLALFLLVVLAVGGGVELWRPQYRYVRGYEDAARWMLAHRATDRPVLTDGELTASVVYHVRLHDPARRVTVLRGDKLLYAMFSDPTTNYTEFARTSAEVLAILHDYDPEFVVVEDPAPSFRETPVAGTELLARTLREHPEQYRRVNVIPLRTNYDRYEDVVLVIYRKLHRNPRPKSAVAIPVHGLGKTLGGG